ncbi:MAG: response regulator [Candidatus Omnitrophica bacterium]|nr:response regulator [Candidatus Omnitrophota bacterium]
MFLKTKSKKVMLVDDEEDFLMAIKFFLEAKGYNVIYAHNGKEALEKVLEMPDIIFLDIKLPDLNGYEIVRRIRENTELTEIPIIMLTCSTHSKDIFESQDIGVTDYLMKTVEFEELLIVIKKYTK